MSENRKDIAGKGDGSGYLDYFKNLTQEQIDDAGDFYFNVIKKAEENKDHN